MLPTLLSYRRFKKVVSLLAATSFIFSNLVFADMPKPSTPDVKKDAQVTTDPEKIVIPRDYGIVKSKYTAKDSRKLVIHIQDAHCNYEAQSNIIKILECLIKNDGLGLISVEGADGFIDTSWFKAFPDADIRKEVADYFMKKGEITGPEFLSITSDYPIKLFGAETRSYYIENLNAFTSSYPLKEDTEKYFNQIKAVLNKLKDTIYSAELKEFDAKSQDYESKKLSFTDYVKYLESMSTAHKISPRQYENLFKLISVLVYEKKIDFNVVDKERATLIDIITKKLDKEQLTGLVNKSLEFKVNKISSAEYYEYLRGLATKYGISLVDDYPNLFNYIVYNSVYSRIENEKLFNDIKKFEEAIKDKLFANDDQRTLDKLSRHINILLGLTNIKLLNGDFDYYKTRKEEFAHEAFADFINRMAAKFGFAYEIDNPSEAVRESMPKLEDFYAIAIKRDKALVDNTIQAMNKETAQISVLITGGFHSEGITKLLEKQNISYIVICPNITKDVETPYIKILTNQRAPLEEILSDTGTATTADAKNVKNGMLAPYLISAAHQLGKKGIENMNRLITEVKDRGLADRVFEFETDWANNYIALWWIKRAEKFADKKSLPRTKEVLLQAYLLSVDAAIKRGKIAKEDREIAANLAAQAFDAIFAGRNAGIKSFPAKTKPLFDGDARRNELIEIFGNETLFNKYLKRATKAKNGVKNAANGDEDNTLRGMFNPVDRAMLEEKTGLMLERLITELNVRGPPAGTKRILAIGGGTGLLASIKPLSTMGAYVQSVQSSVDDGGATFKMVTALIEAGYGWMPSPGDLANSIFKGFASADKLYKLLDDQGRIILDKSTGKIKFHTEDNSTIPVDSFTELCKKLLNRIVQETVVNKKGGIGYTQKTTDLGDDFVYFASGILNVANLMDKIYFKDEIIGKIKDGASIRNLVLLAAMDYIGLIRIDKVNDNKNGSREPMLPTVELGKKFQLALDLMARLGNVEEKGSVALSHLRPETLYTIHRGNVILIDARPGVRSRDNKKWEVEPDLHVLIVEVNKNYITVKIPKLNYISVLTPKNPRRKISLGTGDLSFEIKLIRKSNGNFAFSVNNSKQATLVEPPGKIENTKVVLAKGDERLIATDGTGLIRTLVKDNRDQGKPNEYKYEPLIMDGKPVYVRSRLTVTQTCITETPSYSKIVEIGFTEREAMETEVVNGETVYRLKPNKILRTTANEDVIDQIKDSRTNGIVFGPGSFVTSLIPHFLVKGFPEVLKERRSKNDIRIALIINPTIDNETLEYTISDMIKMIEEVAGLKIDEMFTDIVISKFDTTKLEEYFGKGKLMEASWYVEKVLKYPNLIDELGLAYFKQLMDEFQRGGGAGMTLAGYLEYKIKELLGTLYQPRTHELRTDKGQASSEAKKSRGPVRYYKDEINKLEKEYKNLCIHYDLSLAGIDFVPSRKVGESPKPTICFMPDRISDLLGGIFGLTNNSAESIYDLSRMTDILGIKRTEACEALKSSVDRVMLLNDFAESVGIRKAAALKNMKRAGIADMVIGENYSLTNKLFSRRALEEFRDIQAAASANSKLVDLTVLRLERIIANSINVETFITNLAKETGKKPEEVVDILNKGNIFPTLTATWYLSHPEYLGYTTEAVKPDATTLLKSDYLANPMSAEFYGNNGVEVGFSVPAATMVNERELLALQRYQSAMGDDMARGEYNYRGLGTKQNVLEFFEKYFKPKWYGKIRSFIEQAFGPEGQNLEAIVTNGIGANDQFMWSLVKMYNENKPAGAPVWYHVTTAREFARLYSEGRIKPESTIFVDISRSGTTWEGIEVARRSLEEGFNKRIAIVNGGPSKDIAIAAAQQRSKAEGKTVNPLIIELSPDIGGRNMHRKTSIYYTVQTIAGMFLPSMDSSKFAELNDKFDKANDFAKVDGSLAVTAGRFLHGAMRLLGAEHIVFVTNTESLKNVGTEWEQYIMEGSNKKDVISMGIHNFADTVYEPAEILDTLATGPAGKKSVGMALLDKSAPNYSEDRKRVERAAAVMPMIIFTIEGKKVFNEEGKPDTGITPEQQAAFDILWTDLVTTLTTLLRVDANSNPNVKRVREYTASRVAGWRKVEEQYNNDLIGRGKTSLLVSYGNPGSPAIGAEGKQIAINTVEDAMRMGEEIARQVSGKLKGRDRLNLFTGNEGLQGFVKGLRRDAYKSGLGELGWIIQTAIFPIWSHKGLEANLANQAESRTPGPLLGDETVNIFVNTRKLSENEVTNKGFKNTVDIEVSSEGKIETQQKQLVAPGKGGATVEGANVHQTNDAMTMPNIKRMAEVSPTILFEIERADGKTQELIKVFYESFAKQLAREIGVDNSGTEFSAVPEQPKELTASDIWTESTVPNKEFLENYLTALRLSGTLDNRATVILYDTAIAANADTAQVAQAGEHSINRYLNGKLVNIRSTGRKLLESALEVCRDFEAKGIPYTVVTIGGAETVREVGADLSKIGKILNVQSQDNRYISIIGLYEVALRIANGCSSDDILLCLNRVALNMNNKPFTKEDVENMLAKGILSMLMKIGPVNAAEAAQAYEAEQQVFISL